jgi:hypothetical protein
MAMAQLDLDTGEEGDSDDVSWDGEEKSATVEEKKDDALDHSLKRTRRSFPYRVGRFYPQEYRVI